jgi:hypothetical protein
MTSKGTKNDSNKPPIHFLHRSFLEGAAAAQGFGSKKYGDWNFTKGISYMRLCDAAMRHIIAFMWGEDSDPESGLSHIDHAAANLNMLKFMIQERSEMDDRWSDENK